MQTKMKKIAVVGMSCVFPGANNIKEFCKNIMEKQNSIINVPEKKWITSPDSVFSKKNKPDTICSKKAGLITDFKFDPNGFNIDKDLLTRLDPVHQITLDAGKKALAQCYISNDDKKRTGVILAAISLPTEKSSNIAWKILVEKKSNILTKADVLSAQVVSTPASILARAMGLKGGCYTLDAACASSLYSIKLACDQLSQMKNDIMIAGGVSRPDSLYTQIGFTQLHALSPSGTCSPFDEKADGLVVGEGAGIIVLKRLQDALHAGDKIFGVIAGAGLSNDIKGSLISPASEGQIRAMTNAYKSAKWHPNDIQYIECHGAGTPIGDNVESQSIKTLWENANALKKGFSIGSIKSMIGHTLTAAGAAGVIKTLVSMNEKKLPPSLNFSSFPKNSPLNSSKIKVQKKVEQWISEPLKNNKSKIGRRAGISGFGFGGINAHILLEEFNLKNKFFPLSFPKIKEIKASKIKSTNFSKEHSDISIAIIGMETITGKAHNLKEFQELVLSGKEKKSQNQWKIKEISTYAGEFHIPPNQLNDILPQHILMLKASKGAFLNAGISLRLSLNHEFNNDKLNKDEPQNHELKRNDIDRSKFGAAIGIEFDFNATDFYLRWNADNLKDFISPPLTSNRTLGALGGIVASRIAREFNLGGPCFTVSAKSCSGIKALEIGINSLISGETDMFLCGSVDICDPRQKTLNNILENNFKSKNSFMSVYSEGVGAVILKRLDQAEKDGDRIYAVIKGTSASSGGELLHENLTNTSSIKKTYQSSLKKCFDFSKISPLSISLYETHGELYKTHENNNFPKEKYNKEIEANAILEFFNKIKINDNFSCAMSTTSSTIGDTKAGSLFSLIKTSLCLYHKIIAPVPYFVSSKSKKWETTGFYFPKDPSFWIKENSNKKRRACLGSMTNEGTCSHVIIEEFVFKSKSSSFIKNKIFKEKKLPLGKRKTNFFIIKADKEQDLVKNLDNLTRLIKENNNLDCFEIADIWFNSNRLANNKNNKKYCVSIVSNNIKDLEQFILKAKKCVKDKKQGDFIKDQGFCYFLNSKEKKGKIAFLYPGSGNHFLGMGRDIGVLFPDILESMDKKGALLNKQILPKLYYPRRVSWEKGWEKHAYNKIQSHPHNMILGQVFFGILMTKLAEKFKLIPDAVIGHSLGESASLFALGVWNEPEKMVDRIEKTDLFTKKLAGDFLAAKKMWGILNKDEFNNIESNNTKSKWQVAIVNMTRLEIEKKLKQYNYLYLLIVNSPKEIIIGGKHDQLKQFIKDTNCNAIYLDGIITVHCPLVEPYKQEYFDLHTFKCHVPEKIDFYSCFSGKKYIPDTKKTAKSIVNQVVHGFDYTRLINNSYNDGVRIFIEIGPGSSCTKAVKKILDKKDYISLSLSLKNENQEVSLIKAFARLIAYGVQIDVSPFFNIPALNDFNNIKNKTQILLPIHKWNKKAEQINYKLCVSKTNKTNEVNEINKTNEISEISEIKTSDKIKTHPFFQTINKINENLEIIAHTHNKFLDFTDKNIKEFEKQFKALNQIACLANSNNEFLGNTDKTLDFKSSNNKILDEQISNNEKKSLFTREMCLEFATGSISKVFGKQFEIIDSYPVRVRLPDEPLMLVDRVISIQGEILSLKSGKIVTQHDVKKGAWYLDGGKVPVSISIEAGQADLLLSSWLGIDHKVKGKRRYRLLDAKVMFHRTLPEPGETLEYRIEIQRFLRQGNVYLFFFHYKGYINDELFISMKNGCAGFFTQKEIENSRGIILKEKDKENKKKQIDFSPIVALKKEKYMDDKINALRKGNLEYCFGSDFKGIKLGKNLRLPGNKMHLIDRVTNFDPKGGRFNLGFICAETDIKPDHWFLICHFIDDMVMPGTLMYECCAHTLRIFTQRLGWVTNKDDAYYDIISGLENDLKCRGPVTTKTCKAKYEIEIKDMGYNPEPYIIADAHMFSDNHRIVFYKNIGMKIMGLSYEKIKKFWSEKS